MSSTHRSLIYLNLLQRHSRAGGNLQGISEDTQKSIHIPRREEFQNVTEGFAILNKIKNPYPAKN